jgi:hypothetical protein
MAVVGMVSKDNIYFAYPAQPIVLVTKSAWRFQCKAEQAERNPRKLPSG